MPSSDGWTFTIRILHVSDLHERGSREDAQWRRQRVLGDEFKRNIADMRGEGPIDIVFFTGDLADWGRVGEYEAASGFIDDLISCAGISRDQLFLVPGNHDILRAAQPEAWERLRATTDYDVLSRWMAGGATPPGGVSASDRDLILERQAPYRDWISSIGRRELLPAHSAHGRLGYRVAIKSLGLPFPVQVIGLDTAWLAGEEHDAGKLLLTDEQIGRLCNDERGNPLPGLRLALMHHPLTDLRDSALSRRLLADYVDLLFRGHVHDPTIESVVDPDRSLHQVAAGCLYDGAGEDRYKNACQLATLRLTREGRIRAVDLRFRSWSPRGHWYDDNSLYKDSQNGRLTWRFGLTTGARPVVDILGETGDRVTWKSTLAPDRVAEFWGDPVTGAAGTGAEIGCYVDCAQHPALAQSLFRLAIHAGVHSLYVQAPDRWDVTGDRLIRCVGITSGAWKWRQTTSPGAGWMLLPTAARAAANTGALRITMHGPALAEALQTAMDYWVWVRLQHMMRETLDGALAGLGIRISDEIRTAMSVSWRRWSEVLTADPALLTHFLQAMLTTTDPLSADAARARLGPLTIQDCLLRATVMALAFEVALTPEGAPQANTPANMVLARFKNGQGHVVGLKLNDGQQLHVKIPSFDREPPYVLLANCALEGSTLIETRQRIGSGGTDVLRVTNRDVLYPRTFTGDRDFDRVLTTTMAEMRDYFSKLYMTYENLDSRRTQTTIDGSTT